jgi:inward rectifier potassium channel
MRDGPDGGRIDAVPDEPAHATFDLDEAAFHSPSFPPGAAPLGAPYDPDVPRAQPYDPVILGRRPEALRDFYHRLLEMRWGAVLGLLTLGFVLLNAAFALVFMATGGVAHSDGGFAQSFFFSVQTFATIGYGAMAPENPAAHAVVIVESIVALVSTAIVTGLLFGKFSVTSSRVVFSKAATIGPMNGVPTLMIRIGNERYNRIRGVQVQVSCSRREPTDEGVVFYRMHELKLARRRMAALTRGFTVLHFIDGDSPLHGCTPESLVADDIELVVSVEGTDETTLQPVFGLYHYDDESILLGHRLADTIGQLPDGRYALDARRFHQVVRVE